MWKGHTFDAGNVERGYLPKSVRNLPHDKREAWCDEQTERYRIVARCEVCDEELIAEELQAHGLTHASSGNVRAVAGTLLRLSRDQRREAIALAERLGGA